MVDGGRARMASMMERNEGKDQATSNPYASAVFRRFVVPMGKMIEEDVVATGPGKGQSAAKLLKGLDPNAVAYIAIRYTLNALMSKSDETARRLITAIGKPVYSELVLSLFEVESPQLFHTLVNDMGKRMSKSERYRMTVFRDQAKKNGITFPEWGITHITKVGAYLVNLMDECGLIETHRRDVPNSMGRVKSELSVSLSEDTIGLIGSIKDFMLEACPVFQPCVEKPQDWVGVGDGGWHTNAMKRVQPFAIKTEGAWSELAEFDLSKPLRAINALQGVRWQINQQVLGAIKDIARHYDTDEIIGMAERPKPDKPAWLIEGMTKEHMSPDEQDEFAHWRRSVSNWFTNQKIRGTKYGRFQTTLRMADKFLPYPEIYFVYFADFRGRLYCQSTGISPQGSDLQKAVLRFSVGKPLKDDAAVKWFKINGANKFGFDKESLDDRAAWADEHHDMIMRIATNPMDTKEDWEQADCPMQFMAWCFEYKRWQESPNGFLSHLPVGMDGSCNGLQNFSAMLRDEVGGKATNLLPGLKPNDIYGIVANTTTRLLTNEADKEVPEDDGDEETRKQIRFTERCNRFKVMWLTHGIRRDLVKRSVMTKPYGSTRFSCSDFIVGDYLNAGKATIFAKEEYHPAARYLSKHVWQAISEVVVKADEAMAWLQNAARLIIKSGEKDIRWVTPTGFPVIQNYQKTEECRVSTHLCGSTRFRLVVKQMVDEADINGHKNGIAPNFVHSMDGSHMSLVAIEGDDAGMSMAMIHDDFGTHAADAEEFYHIIRRTFVKMYEDFDPLDDLRKKYNLPPCPSKGSLDIRKVLESPYFFS